MTDQTLVTNDDAVILPAGALKGCPRCRQTPTITDGQYRRIWCEICSIYTATDADLIRLVCDWNDRRVITGGSPENFAWPPRAYTLARDIRRAVMRLWRVTSR